MSSNCKTCGEAIASTGNYSVRLLPAKRVPNKARKLMKTLANLEGERNVGQQEQSAEMTPFQKFLMKRARPANFMELTCGKCGATSKIKMLKQQPLESERGDDGAPPRKKVKESERSLMSPSIPLSSRKSKKRSKDLTAGLTIVMDGSSKPGSATSLNNSSMQQGNSSNPSSSSTNGGGGRKRQASAFQKQKELDNLKRALFHSKKAKKSGSSLKDFLSGI